MNKKKSLYLLFSLVTVVLIVSLVYIYQISRDKIIRQIQTNLENQSIVLVKNLNLEEYDKLINTHTSKDYDENYLRIIYPLQEIHSVLKDKNKFVYTIFSQNKKILFVETVLETIATYKENIEAIKGKIKKALFYPATIVAVAIIVSAILLIFVVPTFREAFQGFGADLPAFTELVFGISDYLVKWWWLFAIVAFAAFAVFMYFYKRSTVLQHFIDRMMLKLPVIGGVLHNSAIARFARTLAVTFKAGVPLVEALDSVAGATGNMVYENAVMRMKNDVSVGYPVNVAMRQVNLFPHMVVQMTAIGEEAGALDTMLFKVAEYYEQEVNNAVDAMSSLIEPIVMVFIGTFVGAIVIAMYLPIFKLAMTVM